MVKDTVSSCVFALRAPAKSLRYLLIRLWLAFYKLLEDPTVARQSEGGNGAGLRRVRRWSIPKIRSESRLAMTFRGRWDDSCFATVFGLRK